jgi:hypothetical protein
MNFKMKLAAVAAFTALSSSAFAADWDLTTNALAADTIGLISAEMAAANTLAVDGNVALINQETASNIAYIDQTGATNFGAITQEVNDLNTGVIFQIGDNNRAGIVQH